MLDNDLHAPREMAGLALWPIRFPIGREAQSMDTRMIMLIRHAEKPLQPSGSPRGVNPDGQEDQHSLTVTGWIRAGALVALFAPSHGDPPPELRRPATIYASAHAGGDSKRSAQTVGPLASRLGLELIKRYAAGDEASLTEEISTRAGATLVAWHHEALHRIAHHLGEVHPRPPHHWPPDRFDVIWTFTPDERGWRFAQVPQLLLPGDLPYPIAAPGTVAKS
jgi:broad specificity phosphatase PhoE